MTSILCALELARLVQGGRFPPYTHTLARLGGDSADSDLEHLAREARKRTHPRGELEDLPAGRGLVHEDYTGSRCPCVRLPEDGCEEVAESVHRRTAGHASGRGPLSLYPQLDTMIFSIRLLSNFVHCI